MKKLQLGINRGFTNIEYHADTDWLSSSKLKLLLQDPADFKAQVIDGQPGKSYKSSDMDIGSLVHSLRLEPELVEKEFAFFKGWRKAGKEFEAFKEDPSTQGKIIISLPQAENARKYNESIGRCKAALRILEHGESELSVCALIEGVPVKMRADRINIEAGHMSDIKTTRHSSGLEFFKFAMEDYDYALSAALYKIIAKAQWGKEFDFYFHVVSKPDLVCDVYRLSQQTYRAGYVRVMKALDLYKQCKSTGIWQLPETEKKVIVDDEEILEV